MRKVECWPCNGQGATEDRADDDWVMFECPNCGGLGYVEVDEPEETEERLHGGRPFLVACIDYTGARFKEP